MIALSLAERREIRALAHAHSRQPIRVVPGDAGPRWVGRSYFWTCSPSPDSTVCRHPSAFARRGWRAYYQASTLQLVVGEEWIAARRAAAALPEAMVSPLPARPSLPPEAA